MHEHLQRYMRSGRDRLDRVIGWTALHLDECIRHGLEKEAAQWVAVVNAEGRGSWEARCALKHRLPRWDCAVAIWKANRVAAGLHL